MTDDKSVAQSRGQDGSNSLKDVHALSTGHTAFQFCWWEGRERWSASCHNSDFTVLPAFVPKRETEGALTLIKPRCQENSCVNKEQRNLFLVQRENKNSDPAFSVEVLLFQVGCRMICIRCLLVRFGDYPRP